MPATVYEAMFIFDANRYGRDTAGVSNQIAEVVGKNGGEILVSRLWEERRLAYAIGGQRKGVYWLAYFRCDTLQLDAMQRQWRLSESILRNLTLKVDPRIVETLVAHAKSTVVAPQRRPREGGPPRFDRSERGDRPERSERRPQPAGVVAGGGEESAGEEV